MLFVVRSSKKGNTGEKNVVNACTGTLVGQSLMNVKGGWGGGGTRCLIRLHSFKSPRMMTHCFSDEPVQRRNNIILKQFDYLLCSQQLQ